VITLHDASTFIHSGGGAMIPVELSGGSPLATLSIGLPNGKNVDANVLLDLGRAASCPSRRQVPRPSADPDANPLTRRDR
jgi:hypothetical protein